MLLLQTNREVDTFLFLIKRGRMTFQIKLKSTMPKGAIDDTSLLVTSLSSVDNENSLIKNESCLHRSHTSQIIRYIDR